MGNITKIGTAVLGAIATLACLTTVGIIGYSLTDHNEKDNIKKQKADEQIEISETVDVLSADKSGIDDIEIKNLSQPISSVSDVTAAPVHTHDYVESIDIKATCYQEGRLKYECSICGDTYYTDLPIVQHYATPEWTIKREPTPELVGLRVKYCIYCDEIVAIEDIPYGASGDSGPNVPADGKHVHEYTSTIEREATCVLAGLRKYTCSCGAFYTEPISAPGHVASDWTTVEEPTTTQLGRQQITCKVCGVIIDSRPLPVKEASASPSSSAAANATQTPAQTSAPVSLTTNPPAPTQVPNPTSVPSAAPKPTTAPTPTKAPTPRPTATPRPTPTPTIKPTPTAKPTSSPEPPTQEWQRKVLEDVNSYLKVVYDASREEIYEYLTEMLKYPINQAVYGADNCGADWNEQAVKSAKTYLNIDTGSSYNIVYEHLVGIKQFTPEQATYGVNNCGADWNEQAVISAKNHLDLGVVHSYNDIYNILVNVEKFTSTQATYGVDNCGADWNEQAERAVRYYISLDIGYSREELYKNLTEIKKFTSEQTNYGIDKANPNWNEEAYKAAKSIIDFGYSYSRIELYNNLVNIQKFTPEQANYGLDKINLR